MDNANSPDYLNKIKTAIIENLSRTKFAPSTQMQDTPREIPGLNDVDEQDAELDDLDEDENKDVRKSQRRRDKQITREDEYSDSDDEEEAAGLDLLRQPGVRRRRNIMDYQNPNSLPDDQPANGTPAPPQPSTVTVEAGEEAQRDGEGDGESDVSQAAERNEDVNMADRDEAILASKHLEEGQVDLAIADGDGKEDVEMSEIEKDAGRAQRDEEDEKAEARIEAASQ